MSFIGIRLLKTQQKALLGIGGLWARGCHFTNQQAAFRFNAILTESQSRRDAKG